VRSQIIIFRLAIYHVIVFAILIVGILAEAEAQTWKWGATTVTLKNGTLRVSGKGAMSGNGFPPCPWRGDTSITNLIIEDGVTYVGKHAFYELKSLKAVTIPKSVTSIGDCAFSRCGFMSITIPSSVKSIGEEAFESCGNLTSITIPGSVKTISKKAFSGCIALESVIIQRGVETIDEKAFDLCESLTSVIIPSSVKTIGDRAFWIDSCRVTSITIPESVKYIGDYAFVGWNRITSITIPEGVEHIGDGAFYGWDRITSVTIPASVTSCNRAFGGTGLISINVHPNNTVYISVGDVLFNKAQNILIRYPRGKQGSYTIPKNVTIIGDGAFAGCKKLTSIMIPNSVTTIGDGAFAGSSLTSIMIPGSVTDIGKGTFKKCILLTSIEIPGSVKTIGEQAFAGCEGLKSIVIPGSVTAIGAAPFEYCTELTSVTSLNPVPPIIDVSNDPHYYNGGLPTDATLYVPASVVNAYKQAPGWNRFRKILPAKK
jgi:hypothetical protein